VLFLLASDVLSLRSDYAHGTPHERTNDIIIVLMIVGHFARDGSAQHDAQRGGGEDHTGGE